MSELKLFLQNRASVEIVIGIVDYKKTGLNKALIEFGTMTCIDFSKTFAIIKSMLEKCLPEYAPRLDNKDIRLYGQELVTFKDLTESMLLDMISKKEERKEGEPDVRKVLGKYVHIYLRDPDDKILNTLRHLYDFAEHGLAKGTPLYISVLENPE